MTETAQANDSRPGVPLGRGVGLLRITRKDGTTNDVPFECDLSEAKLTGEAHTVVTLPNPHVVLAKLEALQRMGATVDVVDEAAQLIRYLIQRGTAADENFKPQGER